MKGIVDYSFERSRELYHKELKACKPMTREEEAQAWLEYKNTGSIEARNRLITSNLRLVANIAKSYEGRGLTYQELLTVGSDGLFKALKAYDETKGFRFTSYAAYWIRQAMGGALAKGLLDAEELPSDHEDQLTDYSSNEPFIASQEDPDKEEEIKNRLQPLMKKLKAKERMVVTNIHGLPGSRGMTLADMAKEMGLSEQRVNQIYLASMNKLRIFALSESALSKRSRF